MSNQEYGAGVDMVFFAEAAALDIVVKINGVLDTVGNQVSSLTSPRAPVVRRQHHAADSSEGEREVVVSGDTGVAVAENESYFHSFCFLN